jgi:hypothetical protein
MARTTSAGYVSVLSGRAAPAMMMWAKPLGFLGKERGRKGALWYLKLVAKIFALDSCRVEVIDL